MIRVAAYWVGIGLIATGVLLVGGLIDALEKGLR